MIFYWYIVDAAMTLKINQPGEEAANDAWIQALRFIKGGMDTNLYTSSNKRIAAVWYPSPDLEILSSISKTSSSTVVQTISTSAHPGLVVGLTCIGVLALAVPSYSTKRKCFVHSNAGGDSSSILTPTKIALLITTQMLEASSSPKTMTQKDSISHVSLSSSSQWNGDGQIMHIPYGYAELTDDPQYHIPLQICFDQSFVVQPPSYDIDMKSMLEGETSNFALCEAEAGEF